MLIREHWLFANTFTVSLQCTTHCVDVSALKIHISNNSHDALEAFPEYVTESRGNIFIKVKITDYLISLPDY